MWNLGYSNVEGIEKELISRTVQENKMYNASVLDERLTLCQNIQMFTQSSLEYLGFQMILVFELMFAGFS